MLTPLHLAIVLLKKPHLCSKEEDYQAFVFLPMMEEQWIPIFEMLTVVPMVMKYSWQTVESLNACLEP